MRTISLFAALTVIAGWAVMFRSPHLALHGLGVAACFQVFVVAYEEPMLRRTFGAEYEAYRMKAGRWIPR